jgi:hypothetical protein
LPRIATRSVTQVNSLYERLKWPRRLGCGRFGWALAVVHGAPNGEVVQRTFSRRAFVAGLGC